VIEIAKAHDVDRAAKEDRNRANLADPLQEYKTGNWKGRAIWAKIERNDTIDIMDGVVQVAEGHVIFAENSQNLATGSYEKNSVILLRDDCPKNEFVCNPRQYSSHRSKVNGKLAQKQLEITIDKVRKYSSPILFF